MEFTHEGDLKLKDADGTFIWSTNTTGKFALSVRLTEMGNLVLADTKGSPVWQSYHHPTNGLVLGQELMEGQKLIASMSETNLAEGIYSLSVTSAGVSAYVESHPRTPYYQTQNYVPQINGISYLKFENGSLTYYVSNATTNKRIGWIPVAKAQALQYMRLDFDGHLRIIALNKERPETLDDPFVYRLQKCDYPMACGKYGICTKNGQCICPGLQENEEAFFRRKDETYPEHGCYEITPLSCEDSQYHILLPFKDLTYFNLEYGIADMDIESCKDACLKNCSCKAAFFSHSVNDSRGMCVMHKEIFSFISIDPKHVELSRKNFTYIKVQTKPDFLNAPQNAKAKLMLGPVLAATLGVLFTLGIMAYIVQRTMHKLKKAESYFDLLPGTPTRFSHQELKVATENFSRLLGAGAFGSVYEGDLVNGIKVAVKRLDGVGHMEKCFIAEVEAIGSIHHVNLVRLIGFCAEKSHRLLVYEYMCNGSLDSWIYRKDVDTLDWKTIKNIVCDIAKGLAYLHEECRHKILHLDIKPQNILLDDKFNAKVSDFGLSKLIDKDQSKVMTTMRGTPGYLAPEWLHSMITDKVDVYSFGVVLVEILCGRKNLDFTQPGERVHLVGLLEKYSESCLYEMMEHHFKDLKLQREEAMELMKVALWCLQCDFSKRPSMSVLVKIFEGALEIGPDLNFSHFTTVPPLTTRNSREMRLILSNPLSPAVLSGPR